MTQVRGVAKSFGSTAAVRACLFRRRIVRLPTSWARTAPGRPLRCARSRGVEPGAGAIRIGRSGDSARRWRWRRARRAARPHRLYGRLIAPGSTGQRSVNIADAAESAAEEGCACCFEPCATGSSSWHCGRVVAEGPRSLSAHRMAARWFGEGARAHHIQHVKSGGTAVLDN